MSAFIRQFLFGLAGLILATSPLAAADTADAAAQVANPAKRQESLENARALLVIQPVTLPAELTNPFNPGGIAGATSAAGHTQAAGTTTTAPTAEADNPAAKPAGPRTDHDTIQAIAAALKPSGFFVLGGEPTLVFGQKRVKAGGHVTITFEGTEYTLEITAIDRPNFTLRLNREEFTRPIK